MHAWGILALGRVSVLSMDKKILEICKLRLFGRMRIIRSWHWTTELSCRTDQGPCLEGTNPYMIIAVPVR